eukprot:m.74358 g.74358  ORF g.74358 m.74358 type:complete len:389 (+) comp7765_c0_seq1:8-1174(+)
MAHLFAFSAGGLQLFSRSSANVAPLRDNLNAIIGPLYAVHLFVEKQGARIVASKTENYRVVWKLFNDSIMLILVQQEIFEAPTHTTALLDFLFHAMEFCLGPQTLVRPSPDALKRAMGKMPFAFLDQLLTETFLYVTLDAIPVALSPSKDALEDYLDAFHRGVGAEAGFILAHGRVVAATASFAQIQRTDAARMVALVTSRSLDERESVVFLGDQPHSLVVREIVPGLLLGLFGPQGTVNIEHVLSDAFGEYWQGVNAECLEAADIPSYPTPGATTIDPGLVAFACVHLASGRALVHPAPPPDDAAAAAVRTLLAWWRMRADTERPDSSYASAEAYMCCDQGRMYTLTSHGLRLAAAFSVDVPVHALRTLARSLAAQLAPALALAGHS